MSIVLRAAAGYLLLLLAVRLIGRRTASMMAPFDLVLLFLFGGITIGAIVGEDHSFAGAVSAVFTIGLMHFQGCGFSRRPNPLIRARCSCCC